MKKDLAIALLSLWFCTAAAAEAQICTGNHCEAPKTMREAIDAGLARESQKIWQQIDWRTDAAQALAEARAQSKPLFVFFVVRQKMPSPTSWVGAGNDMGKT